MLTTVGEVGGLGGGIGIKQKRKKKEKELRNTDKSVDKGQGVQGR